MPTDIITSSTTWVAPAGVTTVSVDCIASGGAGLDGVVSGPGGDGGTGGCFARTVSIPVTPGNGYTVLVGSTTSFVGNSSVSCVALTGSTTAGCVGDLLFAGGAGISGNLFFGGGGGGGAGSGGAGGNGTRPNGGAGGAGNPIDGSGGSEGSPGLLYGGGGGGGVPDGGAGAAGAGGYVAITYTAGTISITVSDTLGFGINDTLNKIIINFISTSDTLGFSIVDSANLTINLSLSDTLGFAIVESAASVSHNLAGYRSMMALWLGGAEMVIRASAGDRIATITKIYNRIADIME